MKIKFPHLLLASSLLVSSLNVSAAASFTDVEPSAWYYDAVENVTENGWLNGTGGSRFTPDGNLTRAMLATILWRIEGSPAPNGSADFIDTDSASWYADGLAWSVENGLFNGYPDGSFRPANAITPVFRNGCGQVRWTSVLSILMRSRAWKRQSSNPVNFVQYCPKTTH